MIDSDGTVRTNLPLSLAIALALLLHVAAIALYQSIANKPSPNIKTIPVVLIKNAPKQIRSTASTNQTSSQSSRKKNNTLTTVNQSSFHSVKKTEADDGQHTPLSSSDSIEGENKAESTPRIRLPESSQVSRAQQASEGFRSMFNSKMESTAMINQVSTTEAPQLSNYELELLRVLTYRKAVYDRYHAIMDAEGKSQFDYEIELILFANGAIKRADITRTSGIKRIDELAKEAAYNASPFPKPPSEDIVTGFRYRIPVAYQKPDS